MRREPIRPDPLLRMEMEAAIDVTQPGLLDDLGIQRCVLPDEPGEKPDRRNHQ